ncbi:SDR family oxidoreductase [Brevundimonas sp.]|jgi:3-oxoacyl-[acyl-carrier protein] reductase|uniref:SDR family oxidoreductase n=1 Tax=Brevundimonas sp. TaxID=1871086 RepID=UPI00181A1D33|nr:SDR family oxidoreductase [Brevundimonas sp.]MBA4808256.1 SDR family oxidoreductase [Brevundimonas sp.]
MDLKLEGRRALVCGGSSGLGRAVAAALVAEGAHVALLSRDAARLQAAADALNAAGPGRAVVAAADLADHAALLEAVDRAETLLGGSIEILLNNTGGPPPSGVSGLDPAIWRDHFESMVLSVFRLTDRVLPAMREAGWGRILNVASMTVVEPSAALGVSNTLRASIAAWAKTLANEVGPDGVTVNTLLPGRIDTPRIERLDRATAERTGVTPEAARAESVKSIPVGRLGAPEEFGAVAAFLASPLAAYVTGSLIRLDGGAIKAI